MQDRVKPSFVMFDIRTERQSSGMSKITNDGLTGLAHDALAAVGVKRLMCINSVFCSYSRLWVGFTPSGEIGSNGKNTTGV